MVEADGSRTAASALKRKKRKAKAQPAARCTADAPAAHTAPAQPPPKQNTADVIDSIFGARLAKAADKPQASAPGADAAEPGPSKRSRKEESYLRIT